MNASQGDEFELGKIALIILSNGVALENKKIIESCENLDLKLYEIITDFYSILEREKSKFPPTSVALYEERLLIYNTNRKLMELNGTSSQIESWENTVSHFSCSPCPSYSTFIRDKKRKNFELDEDKERDQYFKMRSLEKDLLKKEILIFDLEDEVKEKQQKIDELSKKIREYESILPKLNSYEQRAYEYDILIKEYEAMKKSKSLLQESFVKISYDLIEESENQEFLKSTNSILADQVDKLNNELECLKQKEKENLVEIERLKQCESTLNTELIIKMKNEKVFKALLDKMDQLEMRLVYSSEKLDHINYTYKHRIEDLENHNAQYQSINNAFKAQLVFLKDENKQV
jgi:septal ring factor EnvC (AmiA/AmiB activator)